jgi:hypothetical protein
MTSTCANLPSLFWTVLALIAWLFAARSAAGLSGWWAALQWSVAKLFLIDLSRIGSVERIVSFVGVGLLMRSWYFFAPATRSSRDESNSVLPFGLLIYSNLLHAQVTSPRDFAYGQLAIPARDAAAYRFALPLTVYRNTFREDLGDLRVFNAEGVVVPFSLSRPAAHSLIHKTPIAVSMFPLHEGARILVDGVHLTINSAGSAVNLQTQNGTAAKATVRQYLLDARALDATLSALQLAWPEGSAEYTGRLGIEVSDDLAAWRSLVATAPIANLRANDRTLIENRAEFSPTKAKFWRLSWLGTAPSFELTGVLAEPAASFTEPDRASLEVNGVADPKNPREYTFDLGAHPPVSRANVLLPDPNSVIDVELSSVPHPAHPRG